jgi:hypothetical protein
MTGAIERAREAQTLFHDISNQEGWFQADWLLARALLLSGRWQEGLDVMDGIAGDSRLIPARVAMFVYIGDVEGARAILGSDGDPGLLAGDSLMGPRSVLLGNPFWINDGALGLLMLMEGDLTGALSLLTASGGTDPHRLQGQGVLALVCAAAGSLDDALVAADYCTTGAGDTYIDHMLAGIARGMVLTQRADHGAVAVFEQLVAAIDLTEDKINQAVARLARAISAEVLQLADEAALAEEASHRLAVLGLSDTAWRPAFRLAAGLVPVA